MNGKIDFIIAGVQKAGTTALFDYLADDPAYVMPRTKEIHFFDDDERDWSRPDYADYHAHFDWARSGLRGEATPIYCYWPRSMERIAAYNPQIKLILMLRDPTERAWSHWRMETARGVETRSFSRCIREGRRRLFEADPWGAHREFSYVERGFYSEQIGRIRTLFPEGNLLILQAEELKHRPNEALRRVADFLGAPAPATVEQRRIHVGAEIGGRLADDDRQLLEEIFADDQAQLQGYCDR